MITWDDTLAQADRVELVAKAVLEGLWECQVTHLDRKEHVEDPGDLLVFFPSLSSLTVDVKEARAWGDTPEPPFGCLFLCNAKNLRFQKFRYMVINSTQTYFFMIDPRRFLDPRYWIAKPTISPVGDLQFSVGIRKEHLPKVYELPQQYRKVVS